MKILAIILIALGFSAQILAETAKVARVTKVSTATTPQGQTPKKQAGRKVFSQKSTELSEILANNRKIKALLEAMAAG